MKAAARDLEFEKAAALRDQLLEVRRTIALQTDSVKSGPGDGWIGELAGVE